MNNPYRPVDPAGQSNPIPNSNPQQSNPQQSNPQQPFQRPPAFTPMARPPSTSLNQQKPFSQAPPHFRPSLNPIPGKGASQINISPGTRPASARTLPQQPFSPFTPRSASSLHPPDLTPPSNSTQNVQKASPAPLPSQPPRSPQQSYSQPGSVQKPFKPQSTAPASNLQSQPSPTPNQPKLNTTTNPTQYSAPSQQYANQSTPGVPQYNSSQPASGVPQSTPGVPQYNQPRSMPGVPQYNSNQQQVPTGNVQNNPNQPQTMPGVPQFNQPGAGIPQYNANQNPSMPGVPQYNANQNPSMAGVPQYNANQSMPGVPQYNPNQSMPGVPQYNPNQAMPGVPQYNANQPQATSATQPHYPNNPTMPNTPGYTNQAGGLASNFQNLNLGAGATQPHGVNLMAAPPLIDAFQMPSPTPNVLMHSVTQSPYSNSSPAYKRCTLNTIPATHAVLTKSKLPFGLLITPYRQVPANEEPIPVVQSPQIVRCRRCRTYINPWVQFVEQGTRWKCNMCFLSNDVPSFFDWDQDNRTRVDRLKRPELTHGVVEFVAPQEYMVRPPQPVVMLFVIDVSYGAVQSGMVATAAKAILDSLDGIPNTDDRAKIGFITVDQNLHFYNLSSANIDPQMIVVADLEQPYLPIPEDLLVSLTESRSQVESFLTKLPNLFGSSTQTVSSFGKALRTAEKLIGPIGGKIICLQHTLPNNDEGALKMREEPALLGTAKESLLLSPAIAFYKTFAIDCSQAQISIDMFLFNPKYADVATLSGCAKFTGGSVFYYQGFNATKHEDAMKFAHELSHLLSRPLGLEAVLRIRASKGIKMTTFHGNFFLRSTDLLSLPNVSPDNSYSIELALTDDLKTPTVCFQTALLYTSSSGERRIRVLTLCVPVGNTLGEVYATADHHAIASLLVKKAVDRSISSKIEDAREALNYKLAEILAVYKANFKQSTHPQQLMIADNMKLLPVFILGMLKNIAFKDSKVIPSDLRSYMLSLHYVMCPEAQLVNIYPRFWTLQTMHEDGQVGLPDEQTGALRFPPLLNLSSEKLQRSGAFLLENGLEIFIWLGRDINQQFLLDVFGHPSLDHLVYGKTTLPRLENSLNSRLNNIIDKIRQTRLEQSTLYPHLYVVREDGDPSLRMWFLSHLIEDRIENNLSYPQFLADVREKVPKIHV